MDAEKINLSESIYVSQEEFATVFEVGKPTLDQWKAGLEKFATERQAIIDYFFEATATLYGAPRPTRVQVALVFNPIKGNFKGEPIDNLISLNPDLNNRTDIVLWTPKPKTTPITQEDLTKSLIGALHEAEHRFYQGPHGSLHPHGYNAFRTEIDKDLEVTSLREQLFGTDTGYLEATNELVTVYLESLVDLVPDTPHGNSQPTTVEFITDESLSYDILLAAMQYQEENYTETPTTQGPYANIRRSYRKLCGEVLNREITPDTTPLMNEATGGAKTGEMKVSPYAFKGKLPTQLLEEYVDAGKQIDKDFIISLYRLALEQQGL